MEQDTLDAILNEQETPAQTKAPAEVASEENETQGNDTNSSKGEVDSALQWDDEEETNEKEPETKAPDQQDDEELAKIEEKNKWMKGRLAPVKEKLTKAEQELAALRAENEALKAGKAPEKKEEAEQQTQYADLDAYVNDQPSIKALSAKLKELDSKADDMTEKEYIDQKLEILSDLKIEKREIATAVKQHYQRQAEEMRNAEVRVVQDYEKAVLSTKETYPEIDKALARLNKNAPNLDLEIRRSLILEGNQINPLAGDLVHVIGNDKQAMSYLIAQSRLAKQTGRVPTQAIEYIGRLKAAILAEKSNGGEAPDVEQTLSKTRKPGMPKEVRSHSASEPKDLQDWARTALKKGERPW